MTGPYDDEMWQDPRIGELEDERSFTEYDDPADDFINGGP